MQDNRQKMDAFLASVEKRAFYMARMATGNREDALDIVQEAMFSWVRYYQTKPETLWKALFYRVLNSRINDWYRRRRVRHRVRRWFGGRTTEAGDTGEDPIERLPDTGSPPPVEQVMVGAARNPRQSPESPAPAAAAGFPVAGLGGHECQGDSGGHAM